MMSHFLMALVIGLLALNSGKAQGFNRKEILETLIQNSNAQLTGQVYPSMGTTVGSLLASSFSGASLSGRVGEDSVVVHVSGSCSDAQNGVQSCVLTIYESSFINTRRGLEGPESESSIQLEFQLEFDQIRDSQVRVRVAG